MVEAQGRKLCMVSTAVLLIYLSRSLRALEHACQLLFPATAREAPSALLSAQVAKGDVAAMSLLALLSTDISTGLLLNGINLAHEYHYAIGL